MIAEIVVGVWVATFSYLIGRASTRRFRGRAQLGYLGEPEEHRPLPLPAPSLDLLVDLADPSVPKEPPP